MTLTARDITIAITVYDRREFLAQAIESALNQTIPVKVIVVEDCGPDLMLESYARSRCGSGFEYMRNPRRRGLFDNWNACLEYCQTPWLSILHDDDYLKPTFVETMLGLHQVAPGRGLYFGNSVVVNATGEIVPFGQPVIAGSWQEIDIRALADRNVLGFAGHLLPVEYAKRAGGFRATSLFCGDWEMWFKLVTQFGGVQTGAEVVRVRYYDDARKGTSKVIREGQNYAATNVQRKRNYAFLKKAGIVQTFKASEIRKKSPMSVKHMILYGRCFSRRMFAYNVKLLQINETLTPRQKPFQMAVRVFGPRFVRLLSKACNLGIRCP